MDFGFLFHPRRKLLAIGFDVTRQRCDENYYDLLASEARLASFLAVSHGQVPQEHWFTLGRPMTLADGKPTLLSWSGSMFEYLMPLLLMPSYPGTLLESTCRAAVQRQMRFGRRQGTPWGISESCYHHVEANQTYGYRAFGVPGLRLERRSDPGLVIAPYAAALAAIVVPQAACANLQRLERLGCLTDLGFYDAIDYAPEGRISRGSAGRLPLGDGPPQRHDFARFGPRSAGRGPCRGDFWPIPATAPTICCCKNGVPRWSGPSIRRNCRPPTWRRSNAGGNSGVSRTWRRSLRRPICCVRPRSSWPGHRWRAGASLERPSASEPAISCRNDCGN